MNKPNYTRKKKKNAYVVVSTDINKNLNLKQGSKMSLKAIRYFF